jgi:hypothetical protein
MIEELYNAFDKLNKTVGTKNPIFFSKKELGSLVIKKGKLIKRNINVNPKIIKIKDLIRLR